MVMNRNFAALTLAMMASSSAMAQVKMPLPSPDLKSTAQQVSGEAGILGCSAPGSKQVIGAAAGGVAGGIAGGKLLKGKGILGTAVGGASGAALGSWIGCKLQLGDQRKAQAALERAAAEGNNQQWSSAETGASGSATVHQAGGVNGLRFPQSVLPYSEYDSRAGVYASSGTVNLRAAPSVSSAVVGKINPGEAVEVVAGAANSPWLLVAQGGVARGYASSSLLTQQSAASGPRCRLVRQEVRTANGQSASQDFSACPDQLGGWTISRA